MREKYAPELNDPILAANLALLTELMMNLKKLNLKLAGYKADYHDDARQCEIFQM